MLHFKRKVIKLWQCIMNCFQHYFYLGGHLKSTFSHSFIQSASYPEHFTSYVGENGPGLGWSHDTLNVGVFIMIIYIGEIDLQNSYAVLRFVDNLIDILATTCRKNLLHRWKISIEYTSSY